MYLVFVPSSLSSCLRLCYRFLHHRVLVRVTVGVVRACAVYPRLCRPACALITPPVPSAPCVIVVPSVLGVAAAVTSSRCPASSSRRPASPSSSSSRRLSVSSSASMCCQRLFCGPRQSSEPATVAPATYLVFSVICL